MGPIAENVVVGLLILSNAVQLAVSVHDRKMMLEHSAMLALANAKKTITMCDASRELRRLAMKMIRLEDVRLALLSTAVPRALEDSATLDVFSQMDSERLLEIADKLSTDSELGTSGGKCVKGRPASPEPSTERTQPGQS